MTIDDLKQILDLVREHELIEFELEQEGTKLRLRKDSVHAPGVAGPVLTAGLVAAVPSALAPASLVGAAPTGLPAAPAAADEPVELAVVTAPIVGTFYRASAPGAPAFVEIGTHVKKGQVLCIIEAMKLMNEIESEYDGEVVNIYVENGQPVQYGERLFAIKAQ
jgi:acetyl-CoA carboxylase biotin carboxyl carrier protein